ncbi:hypothetical protein Csa_015893 [Cucumis sativus]|uniref:Uncharacterized protein n=1 Tax=Cucumis sativus TaxID=3659 RepID=A0A0A0K563_CUCSA|nr:hypothetical protein Csa_015893 [Cucumis sativus]
MRHDRDKSFRDKNEMGLEDVRTYLRLGEEDEKRENIGDSVSEEEGCGFGFNFQRTTRRWLRFSEANCSE